MREAALEARVYERLKHLQGQCVPRLIAHGSLLDNKAYFVATEFMEVCNWPIQMLATFWRLLPFATGRR